MIFYVRPPPPARVVREGSRSGLPANPSKKAHQMPTRNEVAGAPYVDFQAIVNGFSPVIIHPVESSEAVKRLTVPFSLPDIGSVQVIMEWWKAGEVEGQGGSPDYDESGELTGLVITTRLYLPGSGDTFYRLPLPDAWGE